MNVTELDWVLLLLTAALSALALTWLITWSIARWGSYEEEQTEQPNPGREEP